MADTTILELNKLTTGSHSGTWGDLTNDNMSKIDTSIKGIQLLLLLAQHKHLQQDLPVQETRLIMHH